jgi:uncharacterized radical SAM protein YgiQ
LTEKELDKIYLLPYTRRPHPVYDKDGSVPGFETVKYSIISHRGCVAECSFCGLYIHQGRIIQSRSKESIIKEVEILGRTKDFKGTITDIGGPTANMYAATCVLWQAKGACKDKKCLLPAKCKNLKLKYDETLGLWEDVMKIPGIKHVFIGSGVRYDLLTDKYAEKYLEELCKNHVSGQLKVAPEHTVDSVLELMHKPCLKTYEQFVEKFNLVNKKLNKKQFLINYFISAHPGCDLKAALDIALYAAQRHMHPEQIQDFIPLPMTLSGCMYYTGKNPLTGKSVYVPKDIKEIKMQRALLQYYQPKNRKLVIEALGQLNSLPLRRRLLKH